MKDFFNTINNGQCSANSKRISQYKLFFILILLILVFSSCLDSFILPQQDIIAEDKGWFTLALDDSNGSERTILPKTVQNDFAVYTLEFFIAGTKTHVFAPIERTNGNISTPVLLDAGTYDLNVSAYMDTGKTKLAALGEIKNIVIGSGITVARNITLVPIFDGIGKGCFNWNINYPSNVIEASMTITRLPLNSENETLTIPINNADSKTSSIELFTGFYRVVYKLLNDKNLIAERWETLHVYQNMESDFTFAFMENQFNGALTGTVSISGNPWVGETLITDTSSLGGSGVITYQWMRSGVIINGANSSAYMVLEADVGSVITVTVSRSENSGNVISLPTETIIQSVISINTQPISRNLTSGSISGNLTVVASATQNATISYQWYSNTTNSITGGTILGGETNASFTIPITLKAGTYYYYCEVKASRGAITVFSNIAVVNVELAIWACIGETSAFNAVTVDSFGNIYTIGSGGLVKYNSNGIAQWTRTSTSTNERGLTIRGKAITVDSSGNVYIAGMQNCYSYETFDFGNGVIVKGTSSQDGDVLLVKYNSNGTAQWARTVSSSDAFSSSFESIAVDSSGNVWQVIKMVQLFLLMVLELLHKEMQSILIMVQEITRYW